MSQGEFYSANEYNAIQEYKHFPAESYKKLVEENKCGKEEADLGKETTSLQPRVRRRAQGGGAKTLIDKLFHSVRGVATAATVAAASSWLSPLRTLFPASSWPITRQPTVVPSTPWAT